MLCHRWYTSVLRIQPAPFFLFASYFFFSPVYSAVNPNFIPCAPQTCHGIPITYPFSVPSQSSSGCGYPGFELICLNNQSLLLQTPNHNFTVLDIDYASQTLKAAIDLKLIIGTKNCPYPSKNMTLSDIIGTIDPLPFALAKGTKTGSFYYNCTTPATGNVGGGGPSYDFRSHVVSYCSSPPWSSYAFSSGGDSPDKAGVTMNCQSSVSFPVLESASVNDLTTSLSSGFFLNWTIGSSSACGDCVKSGGRCGFDTSNNGEKFICFCQDDSHLATCSGKKKVKVKVLIGSVGAVLTLVVACVFCFCILCTSNRRHRSLTTAKLERFLSDYTLLTATRYTYNELKRMTNKFEHKLGQGAYGSVFKGKLPNGNLIAVKLVEKSYNDGEEFINEVATLGRIHHVNVVRLLGFCVEGSRRALIYEFMANGSLEKYIRMNESTLLGHGRLAWEKLNNIALGIARGIEYLHQGCDQKIVHFDIKPHNILLDADFTPKISDFGLAKLYCKEQSMVSITEGKGTIGYIAPEVFYGNSRHVSHKSDVYSFGMLLIAMVGMKDRGRSTASNSSDVYFPQCIHDQLYRDRECEADGTAEGKETMKKMTIIALWCIQWNAADRPSMKRVVSMFESDIADLEMPPNRFFPPAQSDYMQNGFESSTFSD